MSKLNKTASADVIVVDGKAYPMAAELVATERQIQKRVRAVAQKLANDYNGLLHVDTQISNNDNNNNSSNNSNNNNSNNNNGGGGGTRLAPISDDNPLIIISVLKGSYIFTADMVRYLGDCGLPHVVDFVRLGSYGGTTKSSGTIQMLSAARFQNLRGKHVLILEDIADSGRTLKYIYDRIMQEYQPASLKTCVLADKPGGRVVGFTPEYVCLTVPNKWVIGYGFEVNDRYRNLRHIFTLKSTEEKRYPAKL